VTKPNWKVMSLNMLLDPVHIYTDLIEFNIKDQISVSKTIIHQSIKCSITHNKTIVKTKYIIGMSKNIAIKIIFL
jgi:hypothetical protein